jgi:hypothetical protein
VIVDFTDGNDAFHYAMWHIAYFGIAFFDNAQVRHAYNTGALKLQFAI